LCNWARDFFFIIVGLTWNFICFFKNSAGDRDSLESFQPAFCSHTLRKLDFFADSENDNRTSNKPQSFSRRKFGCLSCRIFQLSLEVTKKSFKASCPFILIRTGWV